MALKRMKIKSIVEFIYLIPFEYYNNEDNAF